MHYTTLNKIRSFSPCKPGWEKLLLSLGKTKADDEPLSMKAILDSNGINDAMWCIRALDKKYIVGFAVYCAEAVIPIFEKKYPDDERPRKAIELAKKCNAADAADAADAAYAVASAAYDAADDDYAAYAAASAADAADAAARAASAAAAAASAARAAYDADAASAGINITKKALFEQYFCE